MKPILGTSFIATKQSYNISMDIKYEESIPKSQRFIDHQKSHAFHEILSDSIKREFHYDLYFESKISYIKLANKIREKLY